MPSTAELSLDHGKAMGVNKFPDNHPKENASRSKGQWPA